MGKFLDDNGLLYFYQRIKSLFVAAEPSKGLSTNDYTSAEKNKLAGIAANAEVNVQSDWNATDGDAFIKNKPTIPTKTSQLTNDSNFATVSQIPESVQPSTTTPKMAGVAAVGSESKYARGDHVHPSDTTKVDKVTGKGLSTNDYTTTEKTKLTGIEAGAQVNVIETITVNGKAQSPSGKTVNITVPTTVASLSDSKNYALKTDLTNVYKYEGSVPTFNDLPTGLGPNTGTSPVYNVESDGMNYAWNGESWDNLGSMFSVENISNSEIDDILGT